MVTGVAKNGNREPYSFCKLKDYLTPLNFAHTYQLTSNSRFEQQFNFYRSLNRVFHRLRGNDSTH